MIKILAAVQVLTLATKLECVGRRVVKPVVMMCVVTLSWSKMSMEFDFRLPVSLLQLLQLILGFDPGIPVVVVWQDQFYSVFQLMSAPVFDNIEAAIKEHGLS